MGFLLLVQIKQYILQLELAQQLLTEHLLGLIQQQTPLRLLQQQVCLRLAVLTTHRAALAAKAAIALVVLAQLNSPAAQAEVQHSQTAVVVVVRLGRVE